MKKDELEEEIRKIDEDKLIEDMKRVAKMTRKKTVTIFDYESFGRFPYYAPKIKFGGWKNALKSANLRRIFSSSKVNKELLTNDLKRTLKLLNQNTLSENEYNLYGKYYYCTIIKQFGSWNEGLISAGLPINYVSKITKEDLIDNLISVQKKLKRTPFLKDMKKPISKYCGDIYAAMFGSWTNTLNIVGFKVNKQKNVTK